jgi:hypothetical protein
MTAKTGALIVLVLAGALALRELFPKREIVASPPRIETRYDTVRVLDTAWITRLKHDTLTVNLTERVTVTVPETVLVVPRLSGVVGISVGERVGDSTLVGGFTLAPADTGYEWRKWQVQFYTVGPLRSVVMDGTTPRVTYFPPPAPACKLGCKLRHYATGAIFGAALWETVR